MDIYLYQSDVFDYFTQNTRYRTVGPNLEAVIIMNSVLVNHPRTAE